jgi:hypothetical protein
VDKKSSKSLRLSLEWGAAVAVVIALISGKETLAKDAIVYLCVFGAISLTVAFWEHGSLRAPVPIGTPVRALVLITVAFGGMALLGGFVWPSRKDPTSVTPVVPPTAHEIADELAKHLPQQLPPPTEPSKRKGHNQQVPLVTMPRNDWRSLTDWQEVMLRARLSGHKGQRVLILVANTEETVNYAGQFKALFSGPDIGWKVEGPLIAPADEPVGDVQLSISDEYWAHPPDLVFVLKNALAFIGLRGRDTFIYDPNVHQDEIALWIGPPSPHGESNSMLPLEVRCRNPIPFTDQPAEPAMADKAKFARLVTLSKTKQIFPRQTARVFFNASILSVRHDPKVEIDPVGKVMRRNDVLELSLHEEMNSGLPLSFLALSDQDIHVMCVDEWRKP